MQVGLAARRLVSQASRRLARIIDADVSATTALGEEHEEIDEAESEPAHDHVLAGSEHGEVDLGAIRRREVGQPVAFGELRQSRGLARRRGVEMTEGQHDRVGDHG